MFFMCFSFLSVLFTNIILFFPQVLENQKKHTHNLCVKKVSQFKFNLEVSTKYRGKQTSQP